MSQNTATQKKPDTSSSWTTARRAAASARMHTRKPWLKSTGPRTAAGKSRACMNALKHGNRSAAVITAHRETVHYLRQQRAFLKQVRLLLRLRRHAAKTSKPTNELMALPLLPSDSLRKNAGNPRKFLLNMAICIPAVTLAQAGVWHEIVCGQAAQHSRIPAI